MRDATSMIDDELPRNQFKRRLGEGEVQYGLFVGLADPVAAEIAAGAGFDWVMIDTEHGPSDLRTLLAQLQATTASPCATLVRPTVGEAAIVKRILDLGAQTLVVPMVDDPAQAEAVVAAMRYPPRGVRGVGTSLARAAKWNRVADYGRLAEEELCVVAQIESVRALEHIDAIAAVDGIDALFLGPSDLAASLGHIGDPGHAEVQDAVGTALAAIVATGRPAGIFAPSPDAAARYAEMGASFIAVGSDVGLLAGATRSLALQLG